MNVSIGWDAVAHFGEAGAALLTMALLWKIFSRVDEVVEMIPVWEAMAAQYKQNGGNTYRDKVDRVVEVQETHTAILNQLVGAMNANTAGTTGATGDTGPIGRTGRTGATGPPGPA
jgi:hypothetical protein